MTDSWLSIKAGWSDGGLSEWQFIFMLVVIALNERTLLLFLDGWCLMKGIMWNISRCHAFSSFLLHLEFIWQRYFSLVIWSQTWIEDRGTGSVRSKRCPTRRLRVSDSRNRSAICRRLSDTTSSDTLGDHGGYTIIRLIIVTICVVFNPQSG